MEPQTTDAKYIFIDVVGFSRGRSIEAQTDIVAAMNELVRASLKDGGVSSDATVLIPTGDGSVEFRSRIIREEKREAVELLDFEAARTDERIVMCSWCKKVRLESGEWVEVELAVTTLKLFNAPQLPKITHGICERCKSEIAEYSL